MVTLTTVIDRGLIPVDHPLRRIRMVIGEMLAAMGGTFTAMYSRPGRRTVPSEALLKATVLMAM